MLGGSSNQWHFRVYVKMVNRMEYRMDLLTLLTVGSQFRNQKVIKFNLTEDR